MNLMGKVYFIIRMVIYIKENIKMVIEKKKVLYFFRNGDLFIPQIELLNFFGIERFNNEFIICYFNSFFIYYMFLLFFIKVKYLNIN